MKLRNRFALLGLGACLAAVQPAPAAFHLMKVVEVFPGTPASPAAQYVVLQMYSGGQNFVGGHSIRVFDAANTQIAAFTFPSSVPVGTNQTKILVGTSAAAAFFGIPVDLTMTASLPLAGGKVCFDAIDCVAWGGYSGSSTGVGTPFNATGGGLRSGQAIQRRLDIAGSATTLDSTDDTNNSANDFVFAAPAPRNNAGTSGSIPSAVCGDGVVGGLEICDDGNTAGGDGCRADCGGNEICGDGRLDSAAGESCDDGNTVDGDGCAADCGVVANAVPGAALDIRAGRGAGVTVDLSFVPACAATDHAVYWGLGPVTGSAAWTDSVCGLGTGGNASFDTIDLDPGQLLYFVVVGYDDTDEGSYGADSASAERPEAVGVGGCDRSRGSATCGVR